MSHDNGATDGPPLDVLRLTRPRGSDQTVAFTRNAEGVRTTVHDPAALAAAREIAARWDELAEEHVGAVAAATTRRMAPGRVRSGQHRRTPKPARGRRSGSRRTRSTSGQDPGDGSDPAPPGRLTFSTFRRLAQSLEPTERLSLFDRLPESLQRSCWDALAASCDEHVGRSNRQ